MWERIAEIGDDIMSEVIIDGANVIRADPGPSIERLKSAVEKVEDRGFSPIVYADASSKYALDHVTALPPGLMGDLKRGKVPEGLRDVLRRHNFPLPPGASFRKTGKASWRIKGKRKACSINLRRGEGEEAEGRLDLHDLTGPETREYERMVEDGEILEVPGGRDADIWILLRADSSPDSRILSDDCFDDWKNIFPFVEEDERMIRFEATDCNIEIKW